MSERYGYELTGLKLVPHSSDTGSHFLIYREADGSWVWELRQAHSPTGVAARSPQGHASLSAARRSVRSALQAFRDSNVAD